MTHCRVDQGTGAAIRARHRPVRMACDYFDGTSALRIGAFHVSRVMS
jgi:hypothetical protein